MIGLFNAPAEILAPGLAVTPVKLKYAVGNSADLCSRRYCPAISARNFPTVICGFFFNASASASRRVKEVPAGAAPCAGGLAACVAREVVVVGEVVVGETVVLSCRSATGCGGVG